MNLKFTAVKLKDALQFCFKIKYFHFEAELKKQHFDNTLRLIIVL